MDVTRFSTKRAFRLALIAAAAVSVTACASKPKPTLAPSAPPPPASEPAPPLPAPEAGVTPGSTQDFVVNVGDLVYFDLDSYTIRDDATPVLGNQAAWLTRYPAVQVRIEGNADERGTREYNLALGARRANAVRDYLSTHGIDAGRITTVSYGKEKPIDLGSGDEADQKNRNAHTAIVGGARMR